MKICRTLSLLSIVSCIGCGDGGNGAVIHSSKRLSSSASTTQTSRHEKLTHRKTAGDLLLVSETSDAVNAELMGWHDGYPGNDPPKELTGLASLKVVNRVLDAYPWIPDQDLIDSIVEEPDVRWLRVRGDRGLTWLSRVPKLRGLAVIQVPSAQSRSLPALSELQWLRLQIRYTGDDTAVELPELPNLEVLSFVGSFTPGDDQLPTEGQCPSLRVLVIRNSRVSNAGIGKLIEACPNLEYLNLAGSSRITSAVIPDLVKLKSLQYLHIGNTDIDSDIARKQLLGCDVRVGS